MKIRLLCFLLSVAMAMPVQSVYAFDLDKSDYGMEELLQEINEAGDLESDIENNDTASYMDSLEESAAPDFQTMLDEFSVTDESAIMEYVSEEHIVNIYSEHADVVILNPSDTFEELELVEFTMIPHHGYEIVNVEADDGSYLLELLPGDDMYSYSFLMPDADVNLLVTAVTEEEAKLYTGNGILMLTEDNIDHIDVLTEDDKVLADEIESGHMIAFAPIADTGIQAMTLSSEMIEEQGENYTIATIAASGDTTTYAEDGELEGPYNFSAGGACFIEEIYTETNALYPCVDNGSSYTDSRYRNPTVQRTISYVDSNGDTKKSPVYCIEAMQTGNNQKFEVPLEAISFITNSTMKKILYYGYKGPGDICDDYDPTCSHVDWSNWQARLLYTHYALSYTYCGDLGNATNSEATHIGIFKFIDYIKTLKVPSHTNVKLKSKMADGNSVTSNDLSVEMILYRKKPETGFDYLPEIYDDGFQCTRAITVVDTINEKNGITVKKKESNVYDMAFWKSSTDYNDGVAPTVLEVGTTYKLKKGYYFRIFYPKSYKTDRSISYNMILQPIQYLMLDGDKLPPQRDSVVGYQDFATWVYQGTRGKVKLNMDLAEWEHIKLIKNCSETGKAIEGATYKLVAADTIKMAGVTVHKNESILDEFTTNTDGIMNFKYVPPGRYYIQETSPAPGYTLDSTKHYITIGDTCNTVTVNVKNTPDRKGYVRIKKVIEGTSIVLNGAQFKVYAYDTALNTYSTENSIDLIFNQSLQMYESPELVYTDTNLGKFKVKETVNPVGYKGGFAQEFALTKNGETETFTFTAENMPITEKKVIITKLDSASNDILSGAEFTLYEWDNVNQKYKTTGILLTYDNQSERYYSEELILTDNNLGRFLIKETRNPDGYSGEWSQEINISNVDEVLQFTVYNNPPDITHGTLVLEKRDSVTDELLQDAEFTIYQWNEITKAYENTLGVSSKMIYDDYKGLYESELLPITDSNGGKFKIVETKVPSGYVGSWEKEISLTADGQVLNLGIVYNTPGKLPTGEIIVTKRIKESDVNWNHGNPVFHFVVEGKDNDGNFRKYENFIEFDGMESVDANGYFSSSYTFYNIPLGTYKVYEKNVGRYYLNYVSVSTSNATVWSSGQNADYGVDASTFAGANVTLSVTQLTGAASFTNEVGRFDEYSHRSVVKNMIPLNFS